MTDTFRQVPSTTKQNFVWSAQTGAYPAGQSPKLFGITLQQDEVRFYNYFFWGNTFSTAINAMPFARDGFDDAGIDATGDFTVQLQLFNLAQITATYNWGKTPLSVIANTTPPATTRFACIYPPKLTDFTMDFPMEDTNGALTVITAPAVPVFGYANKAVLTSVRNVVGSSEEDSFFFGWLSSDHPVR